MSYREYRRGEDDTITVKDERRRRRRRRKEKRKEKKLTFWSQPVCDKAIRGWRRLGFAEPAPMIGITADVDRILSGMANGKPFEFVRRYEIRPSPDLTAKHVRVHRCVLERASDGYPVDGVSPSRRGRLLGRAAAAAAVSLLLLLLLSLLLLVLVLVLGRRTATSSMVSQVMMAMVM